MNTLLESKPTVTAPLDDRFRPAARATRAFDKAVAAGGAGVPAAIGLEQADGTLSVLRTKLLPAGHPNAADNARHVERLVKFLLWQKGGWRILFGGPREIGESLRTAYAAGGARAFDADLMGGVYEKPFTVDVMNESDVPAPREKSMPLGRHLDGCRIGFDLGASDRKVSAVRDGEPVWSEEVAWNPKTASDPAFHYHEIMSALHRAAARLPRVDAIGGSSAGIIIQNRVRVASLFRGVPKDAFEKRVKPLFLDIRKAWGIPMEVANDGEVTALAGSMSLGANEILGIAMGSSEAGGYVNREGNITTWLNELAFAPVDYAPDAPLDEWSGDRGCGVQYFSQEAVVRLAPAAGIALEAKATPAEKLKQIQDLFAKGDPRPRPIYETIGVYFGYGVAHYATFYPLSCILILGRVTSGEGGAIIMAKAEEVLKREFPDVAARVKLQLPDEKSRRVGQSIAAASLPVIAKEKSR
ncbi:MAG: ROK family protein [Planctomycetota bacterium]